MKTVFTGLTRNYSNEDGELEVMENLRHDGAMLRPIGDPEGIKFYEDYNTPDQREYTMPEHEKIVFIHQYKGREFVLSYDKNLYLLGELIGDNIEVKRNVILYNCNKLIKIVQLGYYLYVHTEEKDYTLRMEYSENVEDIRYANIDISSLNLQLYADEIISTLTREYYHYTNPVDKSDLKNRIESGRYISSNVGAINKILSDVKTEGYLYDACMIRAAIKLKSGDYICQTAPILLHPIGGDAVKLTDLIIVGGDTIKDSENENITYYPQFRGDLEINAYKIKILIPPLPETYAIKEEMDSVDLFIASIPNILTDSTLPQTNQSDVDGIYITKDNIDYTYLKLYQSRIFESGNLSERIKGVATEDFKYVKSYSLDQIKNGVEETLDLKEFNSGSVELRSLNGDGNRDYKYGNPFIYNNALHLSNLTEVLFRGYAPLSFLLESETDTPITKIGVGFSGANSIASVSDRVDGRKDLGYMLSYPNREIKRAEVRVLSQGENGKDLYGNEFFTLDNFLLIPAMFVLGESKKVQYTRQTQDGTIKKLGVHERIAKINIPLKEIDSNGNTLFDFPIADINKRENILKVSDVLNPLVFPSAQTYQVGQGEIKDLAVASTALSQGQFGQFPLYVFCSDGIYAMNVGTNVAYTNSTSVSRDVITGDLISIDKAVAFISDRGLKILQGDSAVDVSLQMQSNAYEQLQGEKFEDFIKGAKLAYNYFFGEIYLLREDKEFAFVYELKNQTWATRKIDFKGKLDVYPDLYIQSEEGVYRLSRESYPPDGTQKVKLKTRPMKWGDGFKKVARMIIRGLVIGNWDIKILASNDGVNFHEIRRASITTDTPKRDIPFGRISGSFKSYVLEIEAEMDERSYIEYLETELQNSIFNNKLR